MLTPALLFMAVSTLVSDSPAAIQSWRTHFYARHRIFFSLYIAALLSIPFRQFAVLGHAMAPITGAPTPAVPLLLGGLLIPLIGIAATNERIHAFLVVIASGLWILNFAQL
jgi:hypothetical protein